MPSWTTPQTPNTVEFPRSLSTVLSNVFIIIIIIAASQTNGFYLFSLDCQKIAPTQFYSTHPSLWVGAVERLFLRASQKNINVLSPDTHDSSGAF
jgi:hypothetical protein